jgi:hypothetical protein
MFKKRRIAGASDDASMILVERIGIAIQTASDGTTGRYFVHHFSFSKHGSVGVNVVDLSILFWNEITSAIPAALQGARS